MRIKQDLKQMVEIDDIKGKVDKNKYCYLLVS